MLSRLHRSYDRMPEPWRELAILADLGLLTFGIAQPWSPALAIGAAAAFSAWILSRIRHVARGNP